MAAIFRELFKGYHVSRRDPELYAQLSNLQDQYRALFKALGYELVCDSRGFYYFVPEQMGAQVNKTAQRLALFTLFLPFHEVTPEIASRTAPTALDLQLCPASCRRGFGLAHLSFAWLP